MRLAWWRQIKAVIRLELKKTFFARRGLWIYLVAAMPVLLFAAYAVSVSREQNRNSEESRRGEKALAYQDLQSVKEGMTKQEVVVLLGKPNVHFYWTEHRQTGPKRIEDILHEQYNYSDGQHSLVVQFVNGKADGITLEERKGGDLFHDSVVFAGVFQFFFLRLAIFFGCLGVFMNLFRGEILDHSLHFYFLAPIRREVLMLGKFLAGLIATCSIFVTSEILQTTAFLWAYRPAVRNVYLYHNHGLEHLAAYVGITVLACIGYGAFFLVAGMFFRNPIAPTAVILIWEGINPFLPPVLKQFSVIYYLKSLCPVDVPVPPGMHPLLSLLIANPEPISAPVAVFGLLTVAVVALYISSLQVRRMEINYTTE
jgi:outer membrane protein assembly factor BamE (lipoprotein component of BamABCDE complex)